MIKSCMLLLYLNRDGKTWPVIFKHSFLIIEFAFSHTDTHTRNCKGLIVIGNLSENRRESLSKNARTLTHSCTQHNNIQNQTKMAAHYSGV